MVSRRRVLCVYSTTIAFRPIFKRLSVRRSRILEPSPISILSRVTFASCNRISKKKKINKYSTKIRVVRVNENVTFRTESVPDKTEIAYVSFGNPYRKFARRCKLLRECITMTRVYVRRRCIRSRHDLSGSNVITVVLNQNRVFLSRIV